MANTTKSSAHADSTADTDANDVIAPPASKRLTKADQLVALLRRPDGASIEELTEALGWLPHTTRAALTGLKKKGHDVIRGKQGSVTVYRVNA